MIVFIRLHTGYPATLLVLAIWGPSARSAHKEKAVSLRGPLKYDEEGKKQQAVCIDHIV